MSEVQGMCSQGQFQVFGVVAKLLKQTDLETDFGICSAKDFNGFMKQLQKNNAADLYPPDGLQWLFVPGGIQYQTIPFPFALVAPCEASTCLKKKKHGSLLHLCEQAGKQIPIIYQFSIIATMFKCEGPCIQPDAHNRSHLRSTRCTSCCV